MVKSKALGRALRLAMFSVFSLVVMSAAPASAKPGQGKRHHAYHAQHKYKQHAYHGRRGRARVANTRQVQQEAQAPVSQRTDFSFASFGGSSGGTSLVSEARRYIGHGNPTSRATLWCARFMNMVLERTGFRGTGSDMARSFASYGRRISGPRVGAIAVMSRGKGGGHVGVVSGVDPQGNPIIVSGNHGRRVAEAVYPANRIYAYVMPSS